MDIKNYARGGKKYHWHRLDIARELLEHEDSTLAPLSTFNQDRLLKLEPDSWRLFGFSDRDWDLCDRLRRSRKPALETNIVQLAWQYVSANAESVQKLYALSATISARLLAKDDVDLPLGTDILTQTEQQSLFAIRIECALRQNSADTIRDRLKEVFTGSWCKVRLLYPLVYHFVNRTPSAGLDGFLSYVVTGKEHAAETEAIKLILSDEAARGQSLAFKTYVGLMGHPFDTCEIVLDHIEFELGADRELAGHLALVLERLASLLPGTRAERLHALATSGPIPASEKPYVDGLKSWLALPDEELSLYAQFANVAPMATELVHACADGDRPFGILGRMRTKELPVPKDFVKIVSDRFVWSFTDAGRLLGALLRSIYMVERSERDLEVRDALRLATMLGCVSAFVSTAPSAMFAFRLLTRCNRSIVNDPVAIEASTEAELELHRPLADRLWINDLQWRLRRLEEGGRISQWLQVVRDQVELRPSFLSGINWEWIEEVVQRERLDPFVSFAGAYLFLLMEGETSRFDPLRLRLTLEPLLKDQSVDEIVSTFIREYGQTAPAIVRRYLSTENLLASGIASNYVAALDMRVRALATCIRAKSYSPMLTEQDYDNEERALTSELLLTNVNTGKFEIPWDTFRKDATEKQRHLFAAVDTLRPREEDELALSSVVETPHVFPNGRNQIYRYRMFQAPMFTLVFALIGDFMEHPAFGIEVILSGRFRHMNLLQELWTAIAGVSGSSIPSVTGPVQKELTNDYRDAMERSLELWCATRLHTKRREKPRALFNLAPDQKDADQLLAAVEPLRGLPEIADVVIGWIKDRLRQQVMEARARFLQEVTEELTARFGEVHDAQRESGVWREQDVAKVHTAIVNAVGRRLEDLQAWFDGVDAVPTTAISLADLGAATEALFDGMIEGRRLEARIDIDAANVWFLPADVKIAFDMLREIYFNALKRGYGPEVRLEVRRLGPASRGVFTFTNRVAPEHAQADGCERLEGSRYTSRDDALFREGNSGRPKVAASAATLVGEDTAVLSVMRRGLHHLVVPLRKEVPCPS